MLAAGSASGGVKDRWRLALFLSFGAGQKTLGRRRPFRGKLAFVEKPLAEQAW